MIFVSYATKNQDMADRIVRSLEAAGLRCWISSRDLKLGMDYQASIVQALDSAAVVLLLLSRAANESLEVPKELSLAGERRKVVIPVRLEDVKPEGALAYQATNVQRIDLFRDFNAQMEALYQRLHGILGDVPPPPPAPPRPARKWRWAAVAVGLVLLASGGVAAVILTGHGGLLRGFASAPHARAVAHTGHLVIGVTHLQGDTDREHERLLLDRLANDFDGAQTLQVDATITVPQADTAGLEQAKAEAARTRAEAAADVLLWGAVDSFKGRSEMRLYWTTGEAVQGAKASGVYQDEADTIALPTLFWSDLKQVLGLLVQSRIADMQTQLTGQYSAAQLAPLIEQVRRLLKTQQGVWNADTDAKVRFTFAAALSDYGDQAGKNEALQESVTAYRKVLQTWTREQSPADWAAAQNGLGVALRLIGIRTGNAAQLEQAVAAHKAALEVWTRADDPADWAEAENNLGSALKAEGDDETGIAHLAEAVAAYRAALEERARDQDPIKWAATQKGLGTALQALGEREKGTRHLSEAVAAYKEALKEGTRERVPLDWAKTENNLGYALVDIAERETGTAVLDEAEKAVRAALTEITRDRLPLKWATVMNILGNVLELHGERVNGTHELTEAIGVYRDALKAATRTGAPTAWAQLQNNMGRAMTVLGARTGDRLILETAVAAQQSAMLVFTRQTDAPNWGQAQSDLGAALFALGQGEAGTTRLEASVAAQRAALEVLTREEDPEDWALAQTRLGTSLAALAKRQNSLALLQEAVACQQNAVDGYTQVDNPSALHVAQNELTAAQGWLQTLQR